MNNGFIGALVLASVVIPSHTFAAAPGTTTETLDHKIYENRAVWVYRLPEPDDTRAQVERVLVSVCHEVIGNAIAAGITIATVNPAAMATGGLFSALSSMRYAAKTRSGILLVGEGNSGKFTDRFSPNEEILVWIVIKAGRDEGVAPHDGTGLSLILEHSPRRNLSWNRAWSTQLLTGDEVSSMYRTGKFDTPVLIIVRSTVQIPGDGTYRFRTQGFRQGDRGTPKKLRVGG